MRFAERMNDIAASGVRTFFDRGRGLRDAIDLSIGQADFDVPEEVKGATRTALEERCGRYSPTAGYPQLVARLRDHLVETCGLDPGEEVMATSGATGAIALALLALAGPGDEVLLPEPYFVLYRALVRIAGATPVFYDLYPGFQLRREAVEAVVSERSRVLLVNSPANPTGAVSTERAMAEVADLSRQRGITVLSDELYRAYSYDRPAPTIKAHLGGEALLVGGFSKAYGMAGWRLGWAAGAPELIDRMRTLQQFVYACPPTLAQRGGAVALDLDLAPAIAAYARKRDRVVARLGAAGYDLVAPGGSFFAFPRVPWGDSRSFCERALDERLILVPGSAFSRRSSHFRLSFSVADETLERGLEVLAMLAEKGG